MIRLVLFDIDGTLLRTGGAGMKAFARAFAMEFGISDGTRGLKFAGRTDTGLAREMFFQNGISPTAENFARFFDTYVFWLDHFLHEVEGGVFPGVHEFLGLLNRFAEVPAVGLLTGNIRLGAEIKLRHYELWDHFETGGFGDDHEERDQVARVAQHRGARFLKTELSGPEILVVGDTPLDIRCARAIGARVVAVSTGGATREELAGHQPDWLVENLSVLGTEDLCG